MLMRFKGGSVAPVAISGDSRITALYLTLSQWQRLTFLDFLSYKSILSTSLMYSLAASFHVLTGDRKWHPSRRCDNHSRDRGGLDPTKLLQHLWWEPCMYGCRISRFERNRKRKASRQCLRRRILFERETNCTKR